MSTGLADFRLDLSKTKTVQYLLWTLLKYFWTNCLWRYKHMFANTIACNLPGNWGRGRGTRRSKGKLMRTICKRAELRWFFFWYHLLFVVKPETREYYQLKIYGMFWFARVIFDIGIHLPLFPMSSNLSGFFRNTHFLTNFHFIDICCNNMVL